MPTQESALSRTSSSNNVLPFNPASKQSLRVIALLTVLALVSLVAATGTKTDWADSQGSAVVQTPANPNATTGFDYFPSQYVNQATEPSDHIQAF